ncbi:hypothetical protein HFN89_03255 [Rhizobium laguerreae]|nr:hypothetical protein [Rhizobium laguerreae]
MSDIAKTMVERIRNAAGIIAAPGPEKGKTSFAAILSPLAPTGKAARHLAETVGSAEGKTAIEARQEYILAAAQQFERHYGVKLASVMALFVPKNDMLYAAAEENIPLDDFVRTIGTQMAFDQTAGKEAAVARFVAGENEVKLALAEFASSDDDWTFSDGYAVAENRNGAVVVAPAYDEAINAWQFSAYAAACDKDAFVAMSRAQKAATPSEDRVYGDIDDCVESMFQVKSAPAAMRM